MATRIPAAALTVGVDNFYHETIDPEFLLPGALYKVYYLKPESKLGLRCVEYVLRDEKVEKVALDKDKLTTVEELEGWLENVIILLLQQIIRISTRGWLNIFRRLQKMPVIRRKFCIA
jgi:hypothetical protein